MKKLLRNFKLTFICRIKKSIKLIYKNIRKMKYVNLLNCDSIVYHIMFTGQHQIVHNFIDIFGNRNNNFLEYSVDVPNFYIYEIANGIILPYSEEVYLKPNTVIKELTSQEKNISLNGHRISSSKILKIQGKVLNLGIKYFEINYYHWMIDIISRYYTFLQSGLFYDYIIIPHETKFQKQLLVLLGIDQKKILNIDSGQFIKADIVFEPSLIWNFDIGWKYIDYKGKKGYQRQYLPFWFKDYSVFLKSIIQCTKQINFTKKIFISRSQARTRKLINESELVPILIDYGFAIVDFDSMDIIEQANSMYNSDYVIGIHGAGLANILFSKENQNVLELYPETYHDASIRLLAMQLNISYTYLICDPVGDTEQPLHENLYLDKNILINALNLFLAGDY